MSIQLRLIKTIYKFTSCKGPLTVLLNSLKHNKHTTAIKREAKDNIVKTIFADTPSTKTARAKPSYAPGPVRSTQW